MCRYGVKQMIKNQTLHNKELTKTFSLVLGANSIVLKPHTLEKSCADDKRCGTLQPTLQGGEITHLCIALEHFTLEFLIIYDRESHQPALKTRSSSNIVML